MKPPPEPQELPDDATQALLAGERSRQPVTPEEHLLAAAGALLRARQARYEAELETSQGEPGAQPQRAEAALERARAWPPGRAVIAAGVAGLICGGLLGLAPWAYGQLTGQEVDLRRAVVSPVIASTGRAAGAIGAAGTASFAVRVRDPGHWAAALTARLIASGVGVNLLSMPGEPIVLAFTLPASAAADVYQLLTRANIPLVTGRPTRLVIVPPFATGSR
jgi:hypothetical protein